MKKQARKLVLAKATLGSLANRPLEQALGAGPNDNIDGPIQNSVATCGNSCNGTCGCTQICIRW